MATGGTALIMMDSVIDVSGDDRFEHGPSQFVSRWRKCQDALVAHAENRKVVLKSFGPGTKKFYFLRFYLPPPPPVTLTMSILKTVLY